MGTEYTEQQREELERVNEERQRDIKICQCMTHELITVLTINMHALSIGEGKSTLQLASDITARMQKYLFVGENTSQQN